jgi:hypothetical protein
VNYAIKQRLRFIDFLLHQYGTFNRSAIIDYFGISKAQAAKDLKTYMKIAPHNTEYSLTEKVYLKTEEFIRVW